MSDGHHGVGLLVANPARSRFYVQQKDGDYPRYPWGYSLFGGACERSEEPAAALARELTEELGPETAASLAAAGPRLLGEHRVAPTDFRFSLFEVCVDDDALDALAAAPVLEGERGRVVDREQLRALPFIWGLATVIAVYLDALDGLDDPAR